MRDAGGFRRAMPWVIAAGVLGAGAWMLLDSQHPGGGGAGGALEPLAPRPSKSSEAFASAADFPLTEARLEALPPAAVGDLDPETSPPGAPAAGSEFDLEFGAPGDASGSPLREQAEAVLLGAGPDARKIAFLRALHRQDPAHSAEAFALAIRGVPARSGPHSTSVPEFALGHLGRRAAKEPGARDVLREVAFGSQGVAATSLRLQAAIHLGRASTGPELEALAAQVRADPDDLVRAGFAAGLLSNSEERLVELLFADLLVAREKLAGDRASHLDPESR